MEGHGGGKKGKVKAQGECEWAKGQDGKKSCWCNENQRMGGGRIEGVKRQGIWRAKSVGWQDYEEQKIKS